MLCLTLNGQTMAQNMDILEKNNEYIDILELRLDTLDINNKEELQKAQAFPSQVSKPVILSFRRSEDGGLVTVSERKRLCTLAKVIQGNFSYIDIETNVRKPSLENYVKEHGIKIIRSMHFMNDFPENLERKASKIALNGDIPKIAVNIEQTKGLIKLYDLSKKLSHIEKKIIIGMGEYGLSSRILYRKVGSFLTFCAVNDPSKVGLLSPEKMRTLFRANEVSSNTKIYGILGNPVNHSFSPELHNKGFHKIGLDAIYVPFNVDDVRAFFILADLLCLSGFSVTVPYKMAVIPYLAKFPRESRQIGACNTVVRENGSWSGSNTDYSGFLSLIAKPLSQKLIKKAIVIGAGGASRAVVWALRNNGVQVTILNRTLDHAKKLALETGSSYDSLENANAYSFTSSLIVQSSSLGMDAPSMDAVPSLQFNGNEIVCDLVYRPHETAFLKRASSFGCTIIHGLDMLLEQGKVQFNLFTGYEYPKEL